MKVIRNKFLPFTNHKAINLFGFLFVKGNARVEGAFLNHEKIHTAQMKEMLYIFFYLWYVIEWVLRLIKENAYRSISFEREAYANQHNMEYLNNRKSFTFLKYL